MQKLVIVRHLPAEPYTASDGDFDRNIACSDEQSERLRAVIAEETGARSFTEGHVSPYRRCRQTAELISSAASVWYENLDLRETPLSPAGTIREIMLGDGRIQDFPSAAFEVRERAAQVLNTVYGARDAIIVTHGDMVSALRWCVEKMTAGEFRKLYASPANAVHPGSVWVYDFPKRSLTMYDTRVGSPAVVVDSAVPEYLSHPVRSSRPTRFHDDIRPPGSAEGADQPER